ncbi:MAG: hypothetical protein CMJ78_10765 [Planctomycetaceae bacterium]|nr:hypothetical protein [Planctomycetaceae bacterium]
MPVSLNLGSKSRVAKLYSFPNSTTCPWTLEETVKHWFDMTLDRDGLSEKGARCSVSTSGRFLVLKIDDRGQLIRSCRNTRFGCLNSRRTVGLNYRQDQSRRKMGSEPRW